MTFDPYAEGDALRDSILASLTETASVLSRQALAGTKSRRLIAASDVRIQNARKALMSAQRDLQRRSVEVDEFEKLLGRLSRQKVPQWHEGPYTPRHSHKTETFWCRPTAEPPKKQMNQTELDISTERLTDPYYNANRRALAMSSGGSTSDEKLLMRSFWYWYALTRDTDDRGPWRAGSAPEPKDIFRWSEPLGLPYFYPPTKKVSKEAQEKSLEKLAQPRVAPFNAERRKWSAPPKPPPANETKITFEDFQNLGTAMTGNQEEKKKENWRAGTTHNAPTRELQKLSAKVKKQLPYDLDNVSPMVWDASTHKAAQFEDAKPEVQEGSSRENRKPWRVPGVAAVEPPPPQPVREVSPSVVVRVSHRYADADFLEGLEVEKSNYDHVTSTAWVRKREALEEWKQRKRLAEEAAKATREVALGSAEERAARAEALRREWAERDARNAARRQARFEAAQRARATAQFGTPPTREVALGSAEERAARAEALRREWAERDARNAARRQARFEAAQRAQFSTPRGAPNPSPKKKSQYRWGEKRGVKEDGAGVGDW